MIDIVSFREQEFTQREKNLVNISRQKLKQTKWNIGDFKVVYVMTHVGICGGTKIILEHVNYLTRFKHQVCIVCHFDKPTWFPINPKVEYIQVPFLEELASGIPSCDVIVATYWREISECIARGIAPVVYFEQGDYHLFDWEHVNQREKDYIYKQLQLPDFIYTVSKGAASLLKKIFDRQADVINNGISSQIFYRRDLLNKNVKSTVNIIAIGSENSAFKGLDGIKKALQILGTKGYHYRFVWITPDEPKERIGDVYVNPKQSKIGELLRKADIYICNSSYESFSLPVLEAMACGCAVITTRNKGVVEYATDNKNCLMVEMNNPNDIVEKIVKLCDDQALKTELINEGTKTASMFSWDYIIPIIVDYYRKVACFKPISEYKSLPKEE